MSVIAASGRRRQVLIALAAAVAAAPAWAGQCPPPGYAMPKPQVRLTTRAAEPVVSNHRSLAEIAALAGRTPVEGRLDAGLTRTETELQVRPTVRLLSFPGGPTCVLLDKVEASWTMRQVIDVADKYRPDSCQYRVVLEHENEHVRLTREQFRTHAARLEARLRALASSFRPVLTDDPDGAPKEASDRMMAGAKPVMEQYEAASRRANAGIDTPASYRAVSARCRGW